MAKDNTFKDMCKAIKTELNTGFLTGDEEMVLSAQRKILAIIKGATVLRQIHDSAYDMKEMFDAEFPNVNRIRKATEKKDKSEKDEFADLDI